MLTASGLLNRQQFGPPVYPPQPEGANETAYGGAAWNASVGPDRFRRGIYTFMKRTTPYAMFSTFDAPSGEVCLAQRESSNTPLQALSLLNDTVILEASEALGEELASVPATDAERINLLFKRCLNRAASPEEQNRITQFVDHQRQRLAAGELRASDLVPNAFAKKTKANEPVKGDDNNKNPSQTGSDPLGPSKGLTPTENSAQKGSDPLGVSKGLTPFAIQLNEIAAWALTARAILNLDETIVRN